MRGRLNKISLHLLQSQLGYQFNNPELLKKALTHSSYYHQKEKNEIAYFQRLEFLGDSVLNLVISEYLYKKFPFSPEGKLSKLKSVMISQQSLVKFAGYIELEKFIILGKSVDLVKGRGKFSILADCMEACLGSVYLDGGLFPCKKIINHFICEECIDFLDEHSVNDNKTLLQEITQKKFHSLPTYQLIKQEGLEHRKKFFVEVIINNHVYGRGIGKSKKEAEQDAAYQAVKKIK